MAKKAKKKDKTNSGSTIALNKKARHNYSLEDRFEAGLALEGWEVKSLRAGRIQLRDSYVIVKDNEAWLLGALITPLPTASLISIPIQHAPANCCCTGNSSTNSSGRWNAKATP